MLSALLFGLSAPAGKALLTSTSPIAPALLAALFYLGSGAGLLVVVVVKRRRAPLSPIPAHRLPAFFGSALAGGVLAPLCLTFGLARTAASTASLLLNLEGVLTAVVAWVVFHEHKSPRTVVGMVLIAAGGGLLSFGPGAANGAPVDVLGPMLLVGACALWAIDNNLSQTFSAADPALVACTKGWVAGGTNLMLALVVARAPLPAIPAAGAALVVGALGYGASLALYLRALSQIGTARTAAYFGVAPFVGAAVSAIAFAEPVSAAFGAAAALMVGGAALHLTERHEHRHKHEPLVHTHLHSHDDEHHQHEHAPGVDVTAPHSHEHRHEPLEHSHPHSPDLHHRHAHGDERSR